MKNTIINITRAEVVYLINLMMQAVSFAEDPYAYAANEGSFKPDAPTLDLASPRSNSTVSVVAASKINKTIPKEEFDDLSNGVVTKYLLLDPDTFTKVGTQWLHWNFSHVLV